MPDRYVSSSSLVLTLLQHIKPRSGNPGADDILRYKIEMIEEFNKKVSTVGFMDKVKIAFDRNPVPFFTLPAVVGCFAAATRYSNSSAPGAFTKSMFWFRARVGLSAVTLFAIALPVIKSEIKNYDAWQARQDSNAPQQQESP